MKPIEANINTIGGGIAPNLFKEGLERLLENIQDEATSAEAKRTLTLEFTFSPDSQRGLLDCKVNMKTKLAPISGRKAMVWLSKDGTATISDPKQTELAFGLNDQSKAAEGE